MNIFAIGVTLLVGLLVILVITNLISRSRNSPGSDHPHRHEDGLHHVGYLGYLGQVDAKGQDSGDWGGRDMSHHHTESGHASDSGGDAGGAVGGGGGE